MLLSCAVKNYSGLNICVLLIELIFRKSKGIVDFWFLFLTQALMVICFGVCICVCVCILTPPKKQANAHCNGGKRLNLFNNANL